MVDSKALPQCPRQIGVSCSFSVLARLRQKKSFIPIQHLTRRLPKDRGDPVLIGPPTVQ